LIDSSIYPNMHHPDYDIKDLQTFTQSGNTRDFIQMAVTDESNLGYGWHRKEIWHKDNQTKIRCTMSEAVAYLFSDFQEGYIVFEIASISAAIGFSQSFSVFVNDNQIAEFVIKDDNMNTYEVVFKGMYGPIEIRLKVNQTFIPHQYFNNFDEREIGIVVKSIRIKPLKQEKVIFKGISLIIPTYNRVNELMRTLSALEQQSLSKEQFEVVIIDDGSTDNTAESVRQFLANTSLDVKYFYQENKKPAAARNLGIKMSQYDLIVFLGDDTTPEKDFLKIHFDTHNLKSIDRKLAVLGYTSWPKEYKVTPFLEFINGYGSQFGYDLIKNGEIVNFSLFYTSNISISRYLLDKLDHLFDENFKIAGWEDTDIGYRLQKKGMSILYNINARTYHYHKINILTFCKRQYNIGKFSRLMFNKHPELLEFLNIHRVSKWSRHRPIAYLMKYLILVCDTLNISLPHKVYSYVLNVHYAMGYKKDEGNH
ncbi:MAG: glycosyltransferase, partial [Thermodesulfovibrionales bacterium]|nr:glycosyltransferase [Thermodesulfovibrionales bacterium]